MEDGTRSRFESPRTKDFSAEEKLRLCKVQALTLKSMLRLANIDRIDFYKSDIEGLDYEVLNCSSEVFKKYKPFLFVSVYHLINDLFEIPKLINTFGMYELSLHNFERDGREMFVVGVPKVTN